TDGLLSFSAESGFDASELQDLYIAPLLFTAFERAGTDQDHRINYSLVDTSSDDPPLSRYRRSDVFFVNSVGNTYREYNGASYDNMSSHIPLISAWDEVSDNTIFVSVDTGR